MLSRLNCAGVCASSGRLMRHSNCLFELEEKRIRSSSMTLHSYLQCLDIGRRMVCRQQYLLGMTGQ